MTKKTFPLTRLPRKDFSRDPHGDDSPTVLLLINPKSKDFRTGYYEFYNEEWRIDGGEDLTDLADDLTEVRWKYIDF